MFLANTNATVVADMEFWFGTPTDLAFGATQTGTAQTVCSCLDHPVGSPGWPQRCGSY